MSKRVIVSVLAILSLAYVLPAEAQQAKVYHVGVLVIGNPDIPEIKGFRNGLKEAGYIDGKDVILDIPAKENYDELRAIAKTYTERKFEL